MCKQCPVWGRENEKNLQGAMEIPRPSCPWPQSRARATPASRKRILRSQEAVRRAAYSRFNVRLDEGPSALNHIDSMSCIA